MLKEYDIDGVLIPFDPQWTQCAISMSGGADSTLLAYLLIDIAKETDAQCDIHIVNHIRMWKTRPWQDSVFWKVYNYFENEFDTKLIVHQNFIPPELEYGSTGPNIQDEYGRLVSGDNLIKRAYAEYICFKYNIPAHYNAVTRNPKNTVLANAMLERDIDPGPTNQHLRIMQHMGRYAIHPFRFIDKAWVIRQYRRLNILNLFNLTRSCEGDFLDQDYQNYKPGDYGPVCGECFWCRERTWALLQQ